MKRVILLSGVIVSALTSAAFAVPDGMPNFTPGSLMVPSVSRSSKGLLLLFGSIFFLPLKCQHAGRNNFPP